VKGLRSFKLENMRETYLLEDLGLEGRIALKWVMQEWRQCVRLSFMWLSTESRDQLLWTR
jgi:hypothetical protein